MIWIYWYPIQFHSFFFIFWLKVWKAFGRKDGKFIVWLFVNRTINTFYAKIPLNCFRTFKKKYSLVKLHIHIICLDNINFKNIKQSFIVNSNWQQKSVLKSFLIYKLIYIKAYMNITINLTTNYSVLWFKH